MKKVERQTEEVATPETLAALVGRLNSPFGAERCEATWEVGRYGASAAIPELLAALIRSLDDNGNHDARRGAMYAVWKLGAAAMPEILSILANRLGSWSDWDYHNGGYRYMVNAIGELGEAAVTPETITALSWMLAQRGHHKECYTVRNCAIELVGKLGIAVATSDFLAALAKLLDDPDEDVRYSATCTAGKLGATAASMEIIAALALLLVNPNRRGLQRCASEQISKFHQLGIRIFMNQNNLSPILYSTKTTAELSACDPLSD